MHTMLDTIYVADLQLQPFSGSQAQAVDHQQEDAKAQFAHRVDQRMNFCSGGNIWQGS